MTIGDSTVPRRTKEDRCHKAALFVGKRQKEQTAYLSVSFYGVFPKGGLLWKKAEEQSI